MLLRVRRPTVIHYGSLCCGVTKLRCAVANRAEDLVAGRRMLKAWVSLVVRDR